MEKVMVLTNYPVTLSHSLMRTTYTYQWKYLTKFTQSEIFSGNGWFPFLLLQQSNAKECTDHRNVSLIPHTKHISKNNTSTNPPKT